MDESLTEKFYNTKIKLTDKLEKVMGQIEENQAKNDNKFIEITNAVQQVEEKLDTKIIDVNINRIELLKKTLTEVQANGIPQIEQVGVFKIRPPVFEGTTSFKIFKLQLETAAKQNNWNDNSRVAALIVGLPGDAADSYK